MKPLAPLFFFEQRDVVKHMRSVNKTLRGNISYGTLVPGDVGQNINGYPTTAVTPAVGVQLTVPHGLNRIPVGFHVVNKNGFVDVMAAATPWTTKNIYLQANAAGIKITLFIF